MNELFVFLIYILLNQVHSFSNAAQPWIFLMTIPWNLVDPVNEKTPIWRPMINRDANYKLNVLLLSARRKGFAFSSCLYERDND